MESSISIDIVIILLIALVILVLAVMFGYKIFLGGNTASNQSFNFINSSFSNITNQSIPDLIR